MALKPWEFERLTPKEFNDLAEGYLWRRREAEDRAAWATTIIANNNFYKKALTMQSLLESLGRKPDSPKRDKAAVAAEFKELASEFNK